MIFHRIFGARLSHKHVAHGLLRLVTSFDACTAAGLVRCVLVCLLSDDAVHLVLHTSHRWFIRRLYADVPPAFPFHAVCMPVHSAGTAAAVRHMLVVRGADNAERTRFNATCR